MTTSIKTCFKCDQEKSLSDFYKHAQMKDGYLNKCKSCTKKDAKNHRYENLGKTRAYDRERGNRQPPGYFKSWKKRYPRKAKAHSMIRYQLVKGNIVRKPCEQCGKTIAVAHHDDYKKPLDVRWLCQAHHKQWHAKNGEGLNGI